MAAAPLSETEARAAAAVDADGLVAAVRRLVRIPSWNGQETQAQEAMADLMPSSGLETDVWSLDLPVLEAHPHGSYEIRRDSALGVVGSLSGSGGGRSLILNGHVDVVPPGAEELWTHPPFAGVVENGRIYGRGALDMKGPLVAGLFALRALRTAGLRLRGTVHLQSVIGEEDGGLGTLAAIERGYRAHGAIVLEPTELAVARVQAGCLNFRVKVRGLAAHGAVREEGVSAIEKLLPLHDALTELEEERNRSLGRVGPYLRYDRPFPISVGTIRGGDWASSVPDHAAMEGRMGVRPDEDFEEARADLETAIRMASTLDPWLAEHPPAVEWWGGRFLPCETPEDHPLVAALTGAASAVSGRAPRVEGVTFGADAGLLARVGGTPAVLFGAGDIRRAHRPDEYVDIDELVAMARTLAVAALRFCG